MITAVYPLAGDLQFTKILLNCGSGNSPIRNVRQFGWFALLIIVATSVWGHCDSPIFAVSSSFTAGSGSSSLGNSTFTCCKRWAMMSTLSSGIGKLTGKDVQMTAKLTYFPRLMSANDWIYRHNGRPFVYPILGQMQLTGRAFWGPGINNSIIRYI